MKLLIVHMRYHPDATGTAPLVTQLAEELVQSGFDVTVITSLPHYGRLDIHPDYRAGNGLFQQSIENDVKLIRTSVFVPRRPRFFLRAINYLSYTINSVLAGFLTGEMDVVLAVNPPITTTFSAWLISFFKRVPLIINIQDIWPDCIIQVGQLKNHLLIVLSRWMEKIQYRLAEKIIVLSAGMKENLLEKSVTQNKIVVIPNWADHSTVYPVKKQNSFYTEHQLHEKFAVLFSGNLGYNAALEYVIEAADLLESDHNIQFYIVGSGSVKQSLRSQVQSLNLSNVSFFPTQPESVWLEIMAACDIALVTLRKGLGKLNVPSKMYTLMAAAVPVICSVPENSEVAHLLNHAECGYLALPEDPQALANKILKARDEVHELPQMGKNGRTYLMNHLTRDIQIRKYKNLISSIHNKESKS